MNHPEIKARTLDVLRLSRWAGFSYVIVFTAAFSIADLVGWHAWGGDVILSGLNWAAGYVLLVQMLKISGSMPHDRQRGAGSYILLSIWSGLLILVGLCALLLPGLVLLVRWLPSYSILLVEGRSVTGSLGEAWHRTRGSTDKLAFAALVCLIPLVVALGAYVLAEYTWPLGTTVAIIFANLAITVFVVAWTALGVAVFQLGREAVDESSAARNDPA